MLGKRKTELKRSGFKPREEPMAGGCSLKRSGPLKPRSEKMKVRQAAKNAAYDHVHAAEWCPACGKPIECTPSHALTTKLHQVHEANPAGIFPLCWTCHCIFENNKPKFKELYPAIWSAKMKAMRDLAPDYFRKKQAFNPDLYTD